MPNDENNDNNNKNSVLQQKRIERRKKMFIRFYKMTASRNIVWIALCANKNRLTEYKRLVAITFWTIQHQPNHTNNLKSQTFFFFNFSFCSAFCCPKRPFFFVILMLRQRNIIFSIVLTKLWVAKKWGFLSLSQ